MRVFASCCLVWICCFTMHGQDVGKVNTRHFSVDMIVDIARQNYPATKPPVSYNREQVYSGFDFSSLRPAPDDTASPYFVKMYYQDDSLVQVSTHDKHDGRRNYDFILEHTDSLLLMFAWHTGAEEADNYRVHGFFVLDTLEREILFFGPFYGGYDREGTMAMIRNIYQLDSELVPARKLLFLNHALVYQTVYDYSNSRVDEKVWQYLFHPNKAKVHCEVYQQLPVLSLGHLARLFREVAYCPCNALGMAESKNEYGHLRPYTWDTKEYYHK